MSEPLAVTDATFDQEVLQSPTAVLVDFWAEWCGPCRMVAPVVEKVAANYADRLKVAKLDVDHNPLKAQQYGVMSIPTLILFKQGTAVERLVGYMPEKQLTAKLSPHL